MATGSIPAERPGHKGNAKAAVKLAETLIASGALDRATAVLQAALEASRPAYDKNTKTWHEVPDWQARTRAIELILANTVGLPVKRQEILTFTVEAQASLEEQAAKSPAMVAQLERILRKTRAKRAVRVESVNGEVADDELDG